MGETRPLTILLISLSINDLKRDFHTVAGSLS
jgi:hypothetical protein